MCGLAFVYCLAHARVNSKAKVFMLPENPWSLIHWQVFVVMQWATHCIRWQIDSVGVLFGFWPRFVLFLWFAVCFAVSPGETQVWLRNFAGRRVWLVAVLFCVLSQSICVPMDFICPCGNAFTAYSHVRTEPLARHLTLEKKNCQPCRSIDAHFLQRNLIRRQLLESAFGNMFQTEPSKFGAQLRELLPKMALGETFFVHRYQSQALRKTVQENTFGL